MKVVGKVIGERFCRKHANGRKSYRAWLGLMEKDSPPFRTFEDMKSFLPERKVDQIVGDYVVFNIGGNNYRLLARMDYDEQTIKIIEVMTHQDYSKEHWKRKGHIAKLLKQQAKRSPDSDHE